MKAAAPRKMSILHLRQRATYSRYRGRQAGTFNLREKITTRLNVYNTWSIPIDKYYIYI